MTPCRDDAALAAGSASLEACAWESARQSYEQVLDGGESPQAREGLGLALWFLGLVPQALRERERAFEGYLAGGRGDDAARTAVWLSHQHLVAGRPSAARGWLARAERALDGLQGSTPGRGWVAVEQARHAHGLQEQVRLARRALRIGRATGTPDLEVFALSLLGRAVATSGRRTEGLELLEEAMAAASSGRARNVHTLAEAYCNLIEGCAATGEWVLADEWCALVEQFAREHRTAPLLGACRTVHADVLLASGHWLEAQDALQTALDVHAQHVPQLAVPTVALLAELRIRQGRLAEAHRLLAQGPEQPARLRVLGLLRLAEGRPAEAVELLERAARTAPEHPLRTAHLLAALVDARLACADVPGAVREADRLDAVAAACDLGLVRALADLATARVRCAEGRRAAGAGAARRAVAALDRLGMPFETAQARLALARALRHEAPLLAHDEACAALDVFRRLGAPRGTDAASELLRGLGTVTAPRPRTPGELTTREHQVLELLSVGASNADIASTLCISTKTAGHHVSSILAKLGARNRTQAAAHAGLLR